MAGFEVAPREEFRRRVSLISKFATELRTSFHVVPRKTLTYKHINKISYQVSDAWTNILNVARVIKQAILFRYERKEYFLNSKNCKCFTIFKDEFSKLKVRITGYEVKSIKFSGLQSNAIYKCFLIAIFWDDANFKFSHENTLCVYENVYLV